MKHQQMISKEDAINLIKTFYTQGVDDADNLGGAQNIDEDIEKQINLLLAGNLAK